tara:strand:+ start:310 stop:933 length:624 start_codon:yes stop_codon:yes gene_type:complete
MPNHDKGRALARFAINTVTQSRLGNMLIPKKKMRKELKQAFKRPPIFDASKLNEDQLKKFFKENTENLKKRNFGKAMPTGTRAPRLDKTNFRQEAPLLYNKKNPLNYHNGGQSGKRGKKKGYAKLDTSNLAPFKGGVAPGIGKFKALGNIAKSFFSTPKQYLKKAGLIKTNREKVTKMSEKFFNKVDKSLKENPKLKKSSSGYYTFK